MNADRFDALTRAIGRAGNLRISRREVMVGAGLTGIAGMCRLHTGQAQTSREPGGLSFDQLAFDLEYDPVKIFRYVADSVPYEPYAGVLRGARGTLLSFGGNSADKTLLLKALLDQALVKTRFVTGRLTEDAGRQLGEAISGDQASAQIALDRLLSATQGTLKQTSAPTQEQITFAEALPAARQRLLDRSYSEFDANVRVLLDALAEAGVDIPLPTVGLPESERTNHVWLQYAAGPNWIDFDPTMPGAEPGLSYAMADGTSDALPDDWHHRVRFILSAESVSGGQPVPRDLLVHEATVADLSGKPFTLVHVKPGWIGGDISDAISGMETYEPNLLIDDVVLPGNRLSFNVGEGVLSALGGGTDAEGQPVAEWFEFEILSPDREPTKSRRQVFDRLTPEERYGRFDYAKLPAIPSVNSKELGTVFVPMLGVFSFAVQGGPVGNTFFDQDYTVSDPVVDRSVVAHGYSFVRERIQSDLLAKTGHRFFHAGPNITSFVLEPQSISADGLLLALKLDLVHQQLGALPLTDAKPAVNAHPLVMAGALSHATERGLMEGAASYLQKELPISFRGVSDVFHEAERTGVPIRVLKSGDDPSTLDCSLRAKAGIAAALALGQVVAVPERSVVLGSDSVTGWWEIDPVSGRAVDRMEDGSGSTLPEWAYVVFKMAEVMECALALGNVIVSVVNSVNKAVGDFSYHYPAHVGLHEALGGIACAAAIAH